MPEDLLLLPDGAHPAEAVFAERQNDAQQQQIFADNLSKQGEHTDRFVSSQCRALAADKGCYFRVSDCLCGLHMNAV